MNKSISYAEKEIADYKIIFKDGTEFLLDALYSESFTIEEKCVVFTFKNAVNYLELMKNLTTQDIKLVERLQPIRIVETGEDKILSIKIFNPKVFFDTFKIADSGYIYYNYMISSNGRGTVNFSIIDLGEENDAN